VFTVAAGSGAAGSADTALLAQIAETSGGSAYEASSAGELQDVYRRLGADVAVRVRSTEVAWWFLAAAAASIVVGAVLAAVWLRRVP
jgi:Ca-activated chloride channel family protein